MNRAGDVDPSVSPRSDGALTAEIAAITSRAAGVVK